MEDGMRTRGHPFDPDLSVARAKQGEDFGRAVQDTCMILLHGSTLRLPAVAQIGQGLKGTSFVFAPDLEAKARAHGVGLLDQRFFACASGSVTVTRPLVRIRTAWPVGHHVRSRCQVYPASRSTHQIVKVLTCGSPSPAVRNAACKVLSDHLVVPS